jgi:transcription-repair coupling factor (superfamily II helicase)
MATRPDADKLIGSFIPTTWVESTQVRMSCYTQLAATLTLDDVDDLERQWIDRFGKLPRQARNLLICHKIKILATRRHISTVEISGQKLLLTRNNNYITLDNRFPRLQKIKPTDKLYETLRFLQEM